MTAPSNGSDAAREIVERGFAVVSGLLSREEVAHIRAGVEAFVARIDPPAFYSPSLLPLDRPELPGPLSVTPIRLAIPCLLEVMPETRSLVLREPLLAPLRALLGEGLRLEMFGVAVSDRARPFFPWHTHIDGEEEGARLARGEWPAKSELERVLVLLYLDDLDDDRGPLFVWPRRLGEPTPPPHDVTADRWPGQIELRPRAGDAVLLEQCTWHAARSLEVEGLRMFIASYFTGRDVPLAAWANPRSKRCSRAATEPAAQNLSRRTFIASSAARTAR